MFGLGFWEILVIALVVIIFVPPRKLPNFFYRLGSIYGELRAMNRNVRRVMRSIERDVNDAETRERKPDDGRSGTEPALPGDYWQENDRTHPAAAEAAKSANTAESPATEGNSGAKQRSGASEGPATVEYPEAAEAPPPADRE